MQYIDFEEVISEAITAIGAAGDDEIAKNFCRQFIWRGLQALGDSHEILTVTKIFPKNLLLKKPKYLKSIDDIALYDSVGNLLPHVWHTGKTRIYPETEGILITTSDANGQPLETFIGPIDLSEDANNIVIGTNGTAVSYAMVRYWQYPLDNTGLPLIREDEVEALILYCRLRWSMRLNQNQSEIAANRLEWKLAADQCKALKKSGHNESRKSQARQFNRMLPNFNRSKF